MGDIGVEGRIILKTSGLLMWTELIWLRIVTCGVSCNRGSRSSNSVKGEKAVQRLSQCLLLNDSVPLNQLPTERFMVARDPTPSYRELEPENSANTLY